MGLIYGNWETLFLCRDCYTRRQKMELSEAVCFLSKRGRFSAAEENEDNTQRETEHQRREEERKISLAGVVGREGSAYWQYCLRLNLVCPWNQNHLWGFPVSINYHFSQLWPHMLGPTWKRLLGLSSLTRCQSWALGNESRVLTTGQPGRSQ